MSLCLSCYFVPWKPSPFLGCSFCLPQIKKDLHIRVGSTIECEIKSGVHLRVFFLFWRVSCMLKSNRRWKRCSSTTCRGLRFVSSPMLLTLSVSFKMNAGLKVFCALFSGPISSKSCRCFVFVQKHAEIHLRVRFLPQEKQPVCHLWGTDNCLLITVEENG